MGGYHHNLPCGGGVDIRSSRHKGLLVWAASFSALVAQYLLRSSPERPQSAWGRVPGNCLDRVVPSRPTSSETSAPVSHQPARGGEEKSASSSVHCVFKGCPKNPLCTRNRWEGISLPLVTFLAPPTMRLTHHLLLGRDAYGHAHCVVLHTSQPLPISG